MRGKVKRQYLELTVTGLTRRESDQVLFEPRKKESQPKGY